MVFQRNSFNIGTACKEKALFTRWGIKIQWNNSGAFTSMMMNASRTFRSSDFWMKLSSLMQVLGMHKIMCLFIYNMEDTQANEQEMLKGMADISATWSLSVKWLKTVASFCQYFFKGKVWWNCKLRFPPLTEWKIKGFVSSLKNNFISVLEEECFVVLEQYFSLCVVNGEIQKV